MTLTLALITGDFIYTGRQVTFASPCESEGLTGVIVDGVEYALVNAMGTPLVANSFDAGAMVSVIFDVENKKAYVQNADTNAYLEGKLAEKYSPENKPSPSDIGASPTGHKHTKSEITDFPTSMTPTAHTHTKSQISDFPTTENWTFTVENADGSTSAVTKKVYVG